MAIKVYIKKGNTNYKEKKFVSQIQSAIEKLAEKDPNFTSTFRPATSFEELKALHDKYCVETVEFTEVKNEKVNTTTEPVQKNEETEQKQEEPATGEEKAPHIDPFNREEPIVRDYVMEEGMKGEANSQNQGPQKTVFPEPVTFDESFQMPGDEQKGPAGGNQQQGQQQQKQQNTQQKKTEPANPNFNDMSGAKKKRSTQRFAKYIVETVCTLSEKGFVWYANKDINESKLAEYDVTGEIDLTILVTLEEGQDVTIKNFFLHQCRQAEKLSVISQEERNDLADALAEVLLEKGIAPTPMQELMMISLKIFGTQAVNLFALKSQTNSLLTQLRELNSGNTEQPYKEPAPQVQPVAETKTEEPTAETKTEEPVTEPISTEVAIVKKEHEVGEVIETKE